MANVLPFPALRPRPEYAAQVCAPPYDVLSSEEAREMAKGNPLSFLHVSKPEIDLDPSIDLYDDRVYAQGRDYFNRLQREGALYQESTACYYLYRQQIGSQVQTGFVGAASCEDYEKAIVKKHELTRPDKENDRVRHIETLNSQTGPVFLIYRSDKTLNALIESKSKETPDVDFTAADGVRHVAWTFRDATQIELIRKSFAALPALYIADGHHRSAAAHRVWKKRQQNAAPSASFLSVIFPHDQLRILPYNRVVKDLNGLTSSQLLERLKSLGTVTENNQATPTKKHELCFYLDGSWKTFQWNPSVLSGLNPIDLLDVSLLQNKVLAPSLGIDDPRTSKRITFVGGIRGTAELEKWVNVDGWKVAFSMYPTSVEDLLEIADRGEIMPPKSTWFEPKLRDAVFCHQLE